MGVVDDDFAFLVATAHRLIDQLAEEVAPRIEAARHGAVLAEHIDQTLAAVRIRVERESSRFAKASSDVARSTLARQLRLSPEVRQMPWSSHHSWMRGR